MKCNYNAIHSEREREGDREREREREGGEGDRYIVRPLPTAGQL